MVYKTQGTKFHSPPIIYGIGTRLPAKLCLGGWIFQQQLSDAKKIAHNLALDGREIRIVEFRVKSGLTFGQLLERTLNRDRWWETARLRYLYRITDDKEVRVTSIR